MRTIHHGKIPNAGPNDWHYVVHEMPDFFARIEAGYRHSLAFVGDLLAGGKRVIGEDGLSVMTSAVPMSKPGAAEAAAAAKE